MLVRPLGESVRHAQIEEFVADLKQVWRDAGEPQFVALAARCRVGKTSLNDAVNRTDRLPTERVLRELLSVIDPKSIDSWVARRKAVHEEVFGPAVEPTLSPVLGGEASENASSRWWRRSPKLQLTWLHLIAAGAALTLLSALLTATLVLWLTASSPAKIASPQRWLVGGHSPDDNTALTTEVVASGHKIKYVVADDSDPADTKCVEDAIVFNQRELDGIATVKIIRSKACNAWWARVERVDSQHEGNDMVVRLVDKKGTVFRETSRRDDYILNTRLLLDEDSEHRYCAMAIVRTAGAERVVEKIC